MIKSPRNIKYTKYQKNYTHSRGTPAKREVPPLILEHMVFNAMNRQCLV